MALPQAFAQVFQKADVNYVIHPDIPLTKVKFSFMRKPLSEVLEWLCKLSDKPIAYLHRNGVYSVFPVFSPEREDWKGPSGRMWVNMGVKKMRLGPVIGLMMEQFGMGCSVPAELKDQVVTVKINAPFEEALDALQKATGTSFHVIAEGNRRLFLPNGEKPQERPLIQGGEGAPGEKRVTIDWSENISVGPALQILMRQMKSKFEFHPDLAGATISIRMEDVPISRALTEIGKASSIPFTYEIKDGIYIFRPFKAP